MRIHINALLILAIFAVGPTAAHAWPDKPITIVVPFAAGGPTDSVARRLSTPLGEALGQPVVVSNVPGATGSIGISRVLRSPADGYTLVLGANSTMTIAPHMMDLPYDTLTDLQGVGGRVTYAYALVVNTELPAKNAAELVKLSKASPSGLTYGSAGVGTGAHLVTELFQTEAGGNFNHAPYKGVAPAQTDLIGGHIDFMFDTVGTAAPLVRAGKLHAIGVTSKSRTPALPDVPAISESIPGFQNVGWYALFAPTGVPQEAINRLNSEINKIYQDAEYRKFFESNDFTAAIETPEELTAVVKEEFSLWGKVVDSAGIKKK